MSRFNELYRGDPDVAADQLECADTADAQELRAALVNALRRIAALEDQVLKLQNSRSPTK